MKKKKGKQFIVRYNFFVEHLSLIILSDSCSNEIILLNIY